MSADLQRKMAALREKFRASLPEQLERASQILSRLSATEGHDPEDLERLHRLLHELSGSAGFLGDRTVAGNLREALSVCETAAHSGRAYTEYETNQISDAIAETMLICKLGSAEA